MGQSNLSLHFFKTIKFLPKSFGAKHFFSRKCLRIDIEEDEFLCCSRSFVFTRIFTVNCSKKPLNEISSENILQPSLFVADIEINDEERKQGDPEPNEEFFDAQEEHTQVNDDEQGNKNLPPDGADTDMEGKISDINEEKSNAKPCGGYCTI